MNKLFVSLLLLFPVIYVNTESSVADEVAGKATFFVSPEGDDLNAGTETAPFKTIERARDAVRQINQTMTHDILVVVGGGEYPIKSTIEFTSADSGKNGHYVTYRAKAGETPLLTGGVKAGGWARTSGTSLYQATIKSATNFRQMYVNEKRAQRAISSNTLTAKDLNYDETGAPNGVILDRSLIPNFGHPNDMELVQVSNWSFHRIPVKTVSMAGTGDASIILDNPAIKWSLTSTGHNRFSSRKPFYLENAYELLDSPGEWYFNQDTDTLFYWPLPGEKMSTAEVYLPITETLLQVRGTSLADKARNLRFEGLSFAHTTELRPCVEGSFSQQASKWSGGDGGYAMTESTDYRPKAAVFLEATDSIELRDNSFSHLGGAGLDALNGVTRTLIEGNAFSDISDSAIAMGDWEHTYLNTGNSCRRNSLSLSNGTIEATIKRVAEHDGDPEFGLAQFENSGNHVKFYHHNSHWKIAKVIAGKTTVVATGPSFPVSDDTDYVVKFAVNGSVAEGFVNGVAQCNVMDSDFALDNARWTFALIADDARVRFADVSIVNSDNASITVEDFKDDPFPEWFNLGQWDLVTDGTSRIQFDDFGEIDEEVCAENLIRNNTIEQTAQEYWGACAISAYIVDGLVIENNRIHNTNYSGITLGWGHGNYPDSTTCKNNIVRRNDISKFNIQCYDGGAIYTTGQMPESLIERNYLHDSVSDHPLRGIQNDNGSGGIEIRQNVIENVKYPSGRDQRWIQYTQRLCHDLFAHDNYTNSTDQRQNGGPDCQITNTVLYDAEDRPAVVDEIAAEAGVSVPAVVSEDFEQNANALSSNGNH